MGYQGRGQNHEPGFLNLERRANYEKLDVDLPHPHLLQDHLLLLDHQFSLCVEVFYSRGSNMTLLRILMAMQLIACCYRRTASICTVADHTLTASLF